MRYRLIFDGEFDIDGGAEGLSELIASRVEDLGDLRLVKVYACTAGCLICRHGKPVEGSFYGRVLCTSKGQEREATDHCMRFCLLNTKDISVLRNKELSAEYDRRIDKFNKLVSQNK